MAKIKVAVIGASGRMGQEICEKLINNKKFEATLAILRSGEAPPFKANSKSLSGKEKIKLDVVVDYSTPEFLVETIQFCVAQRIPLVTGITGLSKEQLKALEAAAKKIPVFYSANMSVGVAAMKAAMEIFSKISGFDFQIIESHHRNKKDKPSGTALALQAELEKVTNKKWPGPISYRVGGVIGEHEVVAASAGEIIRISHEALSRGIFAEGSLRAAEFVCGKKPGMYNMTHIFLENN